jgi:hypothetical protein
MKKLFLLIFLIAPLQANATDYLMVGRGGASCGQFNQDIKQSKQWEYIYFSWAEGYMSAINARNLDRYGESINLLPSSFDGLTQLKYIKTFCAISPDKMFIFAVANLFEQIKNRANQ